MNRYVKIGLRRMICGLKWWIYISYNNVYRIARELRLKVAKDYATKRECLVDGQPKTWKKTGKYRNLHIEIEKLDDGRYKLTVRGSLHKFFHGNNAGVFTGSEVISALGKIGDLFQINLPETNLSYIEVGVNIPVWFAVNQYLQNNLLYHKKKSKENLDGIGFYFEHEDYLIKLYAKERQTLRFEIKFKSKDKLQLFGVTSLADLNENNVNRLVCTLPVEWEEVIIRGGINVVDKKNNANNLTIREREKILEFTSEAYLGDYRDQLALARITGNKRRSDALRKYSNRLRNFCIAVFNERGDQVHSKLKQMIVDQVESFMEGWNKIVPFADSVREGKRDIDIPSIEIN